MVVYCRSSRILHAALQLQIPIDKVGIQLMYLRLSCNDTNR